MKMTVRVQSDREPGHSPAAHAILQHRSGVGFIDHRPEAIAQRQLAEAIHTSPYMAAQRKQLRGMFGNAAQLKGPEDEELQMKAAYDVLQRTGPEEEELLQGKFLPVQRAREEEEELLQGKFEGETPAQLKQEAPRPNNTGMPDHLKAGIEALSGLSMDHVRVHYNSSQPAQLNALAYAQGSEIHVAPGQEQHLPHEAWHVVQQAQGRVQPTMQMKDGVPVNDDAGLEHEADVMGAKALQMHQADRVAAGANAQQTAMAAQRARETQKSPYVQDEPITASLGKARLTSLSPFSAQLMVVTTNATPVQRTVWEWTGKYWNAVRTEGQPTSQPRNSGAYAGEKISTGTEDPWGQASVKENRREEAQAFTFQHDPHGKDKHFKGSTALKQGSQWSLAFDTADGLMLGDVQRNQAVLLQNTPEEKVSTFYLTMDYGKQVGWVDYIGGSTSIYTVQIDVDRAKKKIMYHGYPVKAEAATIGLGRTVKSKDLEYQ